MLGWLCLFLAHASCAGASARGDKAGVAQSGFDAFEAPQLEQAVERLYAAFGIPAGGKPDAHAIRELCAPGAVFVAPIKAGAEAPALDLERFLADFETYADSPPVRANGIMERVLSLRLDGYGNVAHAWVAFEGYEATSGRPLARGLDSIQWVRHQGAWRLCSFTTHYAAKGERLPSRFLAQD